MKRFSLSLHSFSPLWACSPLPALASAKTFSVSPMARARTTPAHIQEAFKDAIAAGPGSTVQLTAGTFTVNSTIYVQNFTGSFKGAGQALTTIDMTGIGTVGLTLDKHGKPVQPWPFLIGFGGGTVAVNGMSVDITSDSPAASWNDQFWDAPSADSLEAVFLVTGSASASFDKVGVTASANDANGADGYNAHAAIYVSGTQQNWPASSEYAGAPEVWPTTGGSDRVTRCSFTGDFGVWAWGLTRGSLTVGGSAAEQNVFNEFFFPCMMTDNSNSDIVVSHNQLQASYGGGVGLYQSWVAFSAPVPPLPAPRYLISANSMLATEEANFVWVEDDSAFWGVAHRLSATIVGNNVDMQDDVITYGADAAIDGWFADGIQVLGNHIWGTALAGVEVGTEWDTSVFSAFAPASGWQITGNDFSGLSPVNPYLSGAAPDVWLGPDATHCLVVGGLKPTTVLDQGTDDTLINVTKLTDPPAATATPMNALRQMKDLKGAMLP